MIAGVAAQMRLSCEANPLKQTPTAIIQHVNCAPHTVCADMLKRELAAQADGLRADALTARTFAQKPANFKRRYVPVKAVKASAAVERLFIFGEDAEDQRFARDPLARHVAHVGLRIVNSGVAPRPCEPLGEL